MHSTEETGLVSCQFVRTCGWSQHSLSSEGTLLGVGMVVRINALVEMANLEKAWVISFVSLPFQLGALLGKGNQKRLALAQH